MKYVSEKAIDFGNVYKVYVLTFPNGKRYVGMTRQNIKKRWRSTGYKSQIMKDAIAEQGWENVAKEVVAENLDLKQAGDMECALIDKYKTLDRDYGYNISKGGDTYNVHSDEFLASLHDRMTGNKYCVGRKISTQHIQALKDGRTEESYRKIAEKNRGRKYSESFKKALSIRTKERWKNQEYRNKYLLHRPDMSGEKNPMYGKTQSAETREKIRAKALGRKMSLEAKRKMSESSPRKRKVLQVDSDKNVINQFNTVKEAALFVGAATTNISFCCKNKYRTAKGYFWRYADDYY